MAFIVGYVVLSTQTFEKEKMMELLSHTDRSRSMSMATDTSIASILSNSDRLIPDAFMPVDIQVVSQRRVRPTSSRLMSQSGHSSSSGLTPFKGAATNGGNNSHYYNNSAHANAAFMRYMTSSTSATTSDSVPFSSNNSHVYALKRKSYVESGGDSAAHPEDDDILSRSRNHNHLSTRDLVRGYA